jgi:hypothetical protein
MKYNDIGGLKVQNTNFFFFSSIGGPLAIASLQSFAKTLRNSLVFLHHFCLLFLSGLIWHTVENGVWLEENST